MIIDCHVHLNNYHNEEVYQLDKQLSELTDSMRRNRVDVSIILTSYIVNPGRPSIKNVVEKIRGSKNLFAVAGISYKNFNEKHLDEIKEYIEEGVVVGFKLYPGYEPFFPIDEKLKSIYKIAAKMNLPVMIHCGDTYAPQGKLKYSHPLNVDEVAVENPDVKFLICHLGNPWMRDTMEVVYKNSNVFTDISGLVLGNFSDRFEKFMHKQLQEMMVWGVEPSKCLYGTDWPISSMESYIEFMDSLGIPQKDKAKMMYENAISLFNLPINGNNSFGLKNKIPFL